jgi:hypothetical protein
MSTRLGVIGDVAAQCDFVQALSDVPHHGSPVWMPK